MIDEPTYTAFAGGRLVVSGDLRVLLERTKQWLDERGAEGGAENAGVLIFEDQTGREVDFDFRGTLPEILERALPAASPSPRTGPGRPKLGVVSREVSMLPRHWEWLEQQPHGLSAALRRLVDEARKRDPGKDRERRARDAASRVMSVLAGNRPGFEEASRALFAGNRARFDAIVHDWPEDIGAHLRRLLAEPPSVEQTPRPG